MHNVVAVVLRVPLVLAVAEDLSHNPPAAEETGDVGRGANYILDCRYCWFVSCAVYRTVAQHVKQATGDDQSKSLVVVHNGQTSLRSVVDEVRVADCGSVRKGCSTAGLLVQVQGY